MAVQTQRAPPAPVGSASFVPGGGAAAPPASVPLGFLAAGGVVLWAFGLAAWLAADRVVESPTHPGVVSAVHVGVLAFLTTAVLGAVHQFAPVVGRRPLRSIPAARATLVDTIATARLLPSGFAHGPRYGWPGAAWWGRSPWPSRRGTCRPRSPRQVGACSWPGSASRSGASSRRSRSASSTPSTARPAGSRWSRTAISAWRGRAALQPVPARLPPRLPGHRGVASAATARATPRFPRRGSYSPRLPSSPSRWRSPPPLSATWRPPCRTPPRRAGTAVHTR